jgi:hypothetical protein
LLTKYHANAKIAAIATIPPIEPPTMAPTGRGLEVGAGFEAVVEDELAEEIASDYC